ncbi:DNA polymerase delta catalytic subunit [Anaeramoeba ignava]|uniref:DNA polymerase n=1 Tax=Anaeramoeba ignava TaxID=1746090 RepID=A0A9Q0LAY1_ANAIG|nr:DNA polymerase delta catalytic subunit [Anaeramoeba ignava]
MNRKNQTKKSKNSEIETELIDKKDFTQKIEELVKQWKREPAKPINPKTDTLTFQQIEIDQYYGSPMKGMPVPEIGPVPILRVYGVTSEGNSVLMHVHGFTPYFYVPAPPGFKQEDCESFKKALENRMMNEVTSKSLQAQIYVRSVDIVYKKSIMGHYPGKDLPFIVLWMCLPRHVPVARKILTDGFAFPNFPFIQYPTFESNLLFVVRFMVDRKIVGGNWIQALPGTYFLRQESEKTSRCQIEFDIAWDKFSSLPSEGEWLQIAPLRILSFDIECSNQQNRFPEPEQDPVIQISNVVSIQGGKEICKNVLTLKSCLGIPGAQIYSFDHEKNLLHMWNQFVNAIDPDIIIGYNTSNFDIPYLINRARKLHVAGFTKLGRIIADASVITSTTFSSRAFGKRESKYTHITGRVQFDLLQAITRDYKLSSYSLNSVSALFLGEQKEDVPHSIISDLQNGDAQTRHRLAVYCLKDSILPIKLLDKLMIAINYIEMARVTGVPINYIISRGQQIKVVSQLYRKTAERNLLIPTLGSKGKKFKGATVISPKKNFYKTPIVTLDFTSLYPSIMIAHNLCYSTLLTKEQISSLDPKMYTETPSGHFFLKKEFKQGILPEILQELLAARRKAKQEYAKETDSLRKNVLNGRQLALKISANSVYGFTGASTGKLPCIPIPESVTSFGRQMIELTSNLVETKYSKKNSFENDSVVIYGDTDSVMINFGQIPMQKAMDLGKEAAKYVTEHFEKPINLEFEKIYCPYLLISKKRYAGLMKMSINDPGKIDAKGIETVRRDNCPLVKNLITICLEKILIEQNVEGAIEYTKQTISNLLRNQLDISLLIITKALTKSGKEYKNKQPHSELVEKMKVRNPGNEVHIGDRIPYVIIKAIRGTRGYERAEDPIYVLENGIPIDEQYYLESQLSKPLIRIFKPILENPKTLLSGDHTRTLSRVTPSVKTGGMMKFVKIQKTCLCGAKAIGENDPIVCDICKEKVPEMYQDRLQAVVNLEKKFSLLWTQCQQCQKSLVQEVLCTSRDCPIFYRRKKVYQDLEEANKTLEKFNELDW